MDGTALGIAAGPFVGEVTGIFGAAWTAIRAGFADMPAGATWPRMPGVAALCGTGFTMSLFIGLPAVLGSPDLQQRVELGNPDRLAALGAAGLRAAALRHAGGAGTGGVEGAVR